MTKISKTVLSTALGLPLGLVGMFCSSTAHADEIYGAGPQWLVIPVSEFHASEPNCGLEYYSTYGYIRPAGCSGSYAGYYEYGLHLPEGAKITAIRLLAYDNDASNDISLVMDRATMNPYSGGSGTANSYAAVTNSNISTTGQQTYWQGPSNYSINQTFDTYDYPNTSAAAFFSLRLIIPASSSALQVHSVHLYWNRQAPPAPATASFTDVPTSHPFFNEVEQLKKSGITLGCGGGNFCPDAPVTRGQMAAFLTRALGLDWDWSTNAS